MAKRPTKTSKRVPARAAKGAGTRKRRRQPAAVPHPTALIPGQYFLRAEPIIANAGKAAVEIEVANAGDRPVQVGSHFHFFEVNRALRFDRQRAYGMRLNVPAGTAVRFEPGQKKKVTLVALGGRREVWGLNGLVNGALKP